MRRNKGFTNYAGALVLALLSLFLIGCGDSENFVQTGTPNGGFVGRYLGANNVSNNQSAVLDFTVQPNGSAAGNLQVNGVNAQATVPVGTYPVSGTVNLNTGTFNLTGNIPGLGSFSISGTLPAGTNLGNYQFVINGQTFQGAIQAASQGTPHVPGDNNGGGGGDEGRLISGGTLSNFVFNPDGNYNGDNPPVDAESTISGAFGPGQNGESTLSVVLSEITLVGNTANTRTLALTLVDPTGDPIEAGDVFPLAAGDPVSGSAIALTETEGTTPVEGWSLVEGTTGQITVVAVDSNSVTLDFEFTNVGPNSEIENNTAEGTFSTSGTIVGNFADLP